MSSTRHATPGSTLRQSRYASDEAYESGLLCNLVAKRCRLLTNPADRALLYFLQQCSWMEGGLDRVAADYLNVFSERIGTPSIRELGIQFGQKVTKKIWNGFRKEFPRSYQAYAAMDDMIADAYGWDVDPDTEIVTCESAYKVRDMCLDDAKRDLAEMLRLLCIDPNSHLISPVVGAQQPGSNGKFLRSWWDEDLLAGLHIYRNRCISAASQNIAQTTISKKIFDDLDYAAHCRGLVIIEGDQRTGKSTAAKNWCDLHPGQAVYVKLGVGNDDATFFRSIAKAIGTASSLARKPTEMQMKIEDALQEGHLTLVFDEAHFLFAQTQRPRSAPSRLDWIRTALVDFNVAIALISTPQFERSCSLYERSLGWNAKQIKGRVKLHTMLPTELPKEDLEAVARKMAPQANAASLMRLVGFAQASEDYLAGIERLTQRAEFFAFREGRAAASAEDIKRALDEAMPRAIAPDPAPAAPPRPRKQAVQAVPMQGRCKPAANTLPPASARRSSLDLSASAEAGFGASDRLQFTGAAASD